MLSVVIAAESASSSSVLVVERYLCSALVGVIVHGPGLLVETAGEDLVAVTGSGGTPVFRDAAHPERNTAVIARKADLTFIGHR